MTSPVWNILIPTVVTLLIANPDVSVQGSPLASSQASTASLTTQKPLTTTSVVQGTDNRTSEDPDILSLSSSSNSSWIPRNTGIPVPSLEGENTTINSITTTTTSSTTTTEGKPPEVPCFPGFFCLHGYCTGEFKCHCNPGWAGLVCENACPSDCSPPGRCQTGPANQAVCICGTGYRYKRGVGCVQEEMTPTSLRPNTTPMPITTTAGPTTASTLRPLPLRQCFEGFTCVHGYCDFGTIQCVCDQGWRGQMCAHTCDLDCGPHGSCREDAHQVMYCDCDLDHSGASCEVSHDDKSSSSAITSPSVPDVSSTTTNPDTTMPSPPRVRGRGEDIWAHLEGPPLPPLEWRKCLDTFVCAYGNCSTAGGRLACSCMEGYTDTFCHVGCPLDCGEFGVCKLRPDNTPLCNCLDPTYTGANCSEFRPLNLPQEQEGSTGLAPFALGLIIAASLLSMVLLIVIILYVLWRRRNITMMKLVFWFQKFEEDDDRDYDAFVSYASTDQDRQFVIQTLVPKLEGPLCFTLCIHQRDFMPGLFITDNITESVKRSRRTILVVSPSFISSGWCKFEYQMALQEMLNEKHRIVPILLEDVSDLEDQMDGTLNNILNSVTWLKYPPSDASAQDFDKFWTRLTLSMPKKRPNQLEGINNQSCLAKTPPPSMVSLPSLTSSTTQFQLGSLEIPTMQNGKPEQKEKSKGKNLRQDSYEQKSARISTALGRLLGRFDSTESSTSQEVSEPYFYLNHSEPASPSGDHYYDGVRRHSSSLPTSQSQDLPLQDLAPRKYSDPSNNALQKMVREPILLNCLGDQSLCRQSAA